MEESSDYNSNPSVIIDTDDSLCEESNYNENTEPYQPDCGDGSNSIDNLKSKESKHKDRSVKVVGYYIKDNSLFETVKEKTINPIINPLKKIKNKLRR